MTSKDKEILNRLTTHINKMRGINPIQLAEDAITEKTTPENPPKIKSIPLGIYIDTDGINKPSGK